MGLIRTGLVNGGHSETQMTRISHPQNDLGEKYSRKQDQHMQRL